MLRLELYNRNEVTAHQEQQYLLKNSELRTLISTTKRKPSANICKNTFLQSDWKSQANIGVGRDNFFDPVTNCLYRIHFLFEFFTIDEHDCEKSPAFISGTRINHSDANGGVQSGFARGFLFRLA